MAKAQDVLLYSEQKEPSEERPILYDFVRATPKHVTEEQVRVVATALGIE